MAVVALEKAVVVLLVATEAIRADMMEAMTLVREVVDLADPCEEDLFASVAHRVA